MKQLNKEYNIPQEILYTVCLTAWNLCRKNLSQFAALKPYYTETFIAEAIDGVNKAKQLPGLMQTSATRKEARIHLTNAGKKMMLNWQLLKRYIIKAYDKNIAETMLQAAGESFYKKAGLYNWSAVRSLISAGNIFIAGELDALTANGNMPAGFQSTFAAAGENFMSLSDSFFKISIGKESATQTKIEAKNAIYRSVIEMLKDGQLIFRNDPATRNQFIFKHLVSMQRGEGAASLKGCIVNSLNQPVEGVTIQSQDQKYSSTTDSKGNYRISRIAAGTYTFLIAGAGYHSILQTITFATGTGSRVDFVMEKGMQRVA